MCVVVPFLCVSAASEVSECDLYDRSVFTSDLIC